MKIPMIAALLAAMVARAGAQDDQQQPIVNQPPAFMVSLLFVQQDRFR